MSDKTQQGISLGFSILSVYLFFSILYSWMGGQLPLFAPGIFLFRSFHALGLFVPLFIAGLGRLLLSNPFRKKSFLRMNLMILPFFTLSLMLKLLVPGQVSPAEKYFLNAFGVPVSLTLLLMLTALSLLIILKLTDYLFPGDEGSLFSLGEFFSDLLPSRDRSEEDTLVDKKQELRRPEPLEPLNPIGFKSQDKDFSTPSFPEQLPPVDKTPEDDELQDLIGQVLRGKSQPEMKPLQPAYSPDMTLEEVSSPEFVPLDTRETAELKIPSIEEVLASRPVNSVTSSEAEERSEKVNLEVTPLMEDRQEEAPEIPLYLSDENKSADYKDQSEEKLDSLLNTLNNVLEEDRPQSISDKLSPETPVVQTEPMAATPVLRKRKPKKMKYSLPSEGLLQEYPESNYSEVDEDTKRASAILEETLREFKIDAKVTGIARGPVITMFELLPAPGVKLSKIVALQDNIALRLAASRVRIVAPIPGKHAVGIEIPNKKRSLVGFSQLVNAKDMINRKHEIPIVLGKDINGGDQVIDLTRTPHLLIAGSTGSGKSVCVNSLICSLLYQRSPQEVKMILVDPKIVELKLYNDIPHLLTPVITEPKKAFQAVQWALYEMERRYALLDGMGVRDIKTYNKRIIEREIATEKLPYLVVIIDEFADLMATSGKELEGIVARLAAMSRAVGIHLVLATQRPSTDVITGLIKANFPSRIAFMVASMTDSRIIIDSAGAEKLLGRGDMLFTSSWDPFPTRVQGSFLSEEEVERVVDYVKTLGEPDYIDDEIFVEEEESSDDFSLQGDYGEDPLFDRALEVVVNSGKASASYLQRRLKIGYNRAARLVEDMEERGIVGPANGSKAREVLHIPDRHVPAEQPSLS